MIELLKKRAEKGLIASKWLRALLNTHSSHLMTYPDITERLGSMYELLESHTKIYPKLARLHGKLLLISSQINNHNKELSNNDDKLSTKPSLIFEDVSDEDIDGDQTQDELIPSPSEYDDYSGLSDDLDLGIENDDNEDEIEEINESDTDIHFQHDGYLKDDDDNDSS
ncbi:unnamed protein product [Rotaria sordida]|uniref:Small-subunit processome Utp12 domain-containing protein n=1 Tax=Rotaria sordida TaxID=392033 RepID=A0A815AK99_9BILA|nr:unnamed protein product [Rotaria sordida]